MGSADRLGRPGARWLATALARVLERANGADRSRPRAARTSVAVVMLAWNPQNARGAARALAEQLRAAAPNARLVLVDNRGHGMEWAPDEGFDYVVGDNSAREFSGLQAGIEHVRKGGSPEVWVLANDRYAVDSDECLRLLDGPTFDAVAEMGALSGHLDRYPTATNAFGLEIGSWARSNLLVAADDALRRIGPLVTVTEATLASVVEDNARAGPLFRSDGPLDPMYRRYLTEWLTGEGTALAQHWYRSAPVSPATWSELRTKARSVLNEHLLSARAQDLGVPVVALAGASNAGRLGAGSILYRLVTASVRLEPRRSRPLLTGSVARTLVALHLVSVRLGNVIRPWWRFLWPAGPSDQHHQRIGPPSEPSARRSTMARPLRAPVRPSALGRWQA